MTTWQAPSLNRVFYAVLAGLLVVALAMYGPRVVRNTSFRSIDSATLSDGTRLHLTEHKATKWLHVTSRSLLIFDLKISSGASQGRPGAIVTDSLDHDFLLKTDPARRRAWVVGQPSGTVLFSVDYDNDEWWPADEPQPPWAAP